MRIGVEVLTMRSVLLPILAVLLFAATPVCGQEPTPTMTTEDVAPAGEPDSSLADVTLYDLTTRPDDYLEGSHIIECEHIWEARREGGFDLKDKDRFARTRNVFFSVRSAQLYEAIDRNDDLEWMRVRVRFSLRVVRIGDAEPIYAANATSVEFLNKDGSTFLTIR